MRYLVSIHHPAQVHFFRHVVDELQAAGHEVRVCVRDKEVAVDLLDAYGVDHTVLAHAADSLPRLAATQLAYEYRLLRAARAFRPDVLTSIGGLEISHVAPLVGARSVAFQDSEAVPLEPLTTSLLDAVWTPAQFDGDFGASHRRYDGYHELAYLHPARFDPDPAALRDHRVDPEETYAVLRFVAWQAHHDVGDDGFSRAAKRELVDRLSDHGAVYVTSEDPLPPAFEPYRLPVPPHLAHDLLAFADCYVGDSGTMATEAAVLGTPAVRSSSHVDDDMSNFVELESAYGLLCSHADEDAAIDRAVDLVADPEAGETWRQRRRDLLSDKTDVTTVAVEALEEAGRTARAAPSTSRTTAIDRVHERLFGGGFE